jgi:hypothetical protein
MSEEKLMAVMGSKRSIDLKWISWLIEHREHVLPLVEAVKAFVAATTWDERWQAIKVVGDIITSHLDELLGPGGTEDVVVDDVFTVGAHAKLGALDHETRDSIGALVVFLPQLIAMAKMIYQIINSFKK